MWEKQSCSDKCFFRKAKCRGCQSIGHIVKKCPEKPDNNNSKLTKAKGKDEKKKKRKPRGIRHLTVNSDSGSDSESQEEVMKPAWPLFTLSDSARKCKELKVLVSIEGTPVNMEVDTGAAVSIMPENIWWKLSAKPVRKSNIKLRSYSGHEVPVIGEVDVNVVYGNQEARLPVIVTSNAGPVLLERSWLSVLKLNWSQIKKVSAQPANEVEKLITKYSSLFDDTLDTIKGVKAHLEMKPNSTPKFFKPRPVPFALKDKIGEELKRLEKLGVLEKIEFSDWATPIVPVLKPDGSVQICSDYKVTINPCLEVQEYPIPTAEELFAQLNGGEKFSKIDLSAAYHQVLLDDESRKYVTINTHLGLYRYTRLPFGVAASPAIFQKTVDVVLNGLQGVGGILDDLIITGKTDEEHLRNLDNTLNRLQSMGIQLKRSKCVFMQPSVEYFAFVVDQQGIRLSPRKVQAIREVPVPDNATDLKSFLGLVNYYRKFILDMATLVNPPNRLLAQNVSWCWPDHCQKSFEKLKAALENSPLLTHYDSKKPVRLAVDASSCGVGAVLSHVSEEGDEQPIAYASRTLSSSEQNYSMIEKEALAIIFGLK